MEVSPPLQEIFDTYRKSATNKEAFELGISSIVRAIEEYGHSHYKVALAVDENLLRSGCNRGMYRELVDHNFTTVRGLTVKAPSDVKEPVLDSQYKGNEPAYADLVNSYGTSDMIFAQTKKTGDRAVFDYMLSHNRMITQKELKDLVNKQLAKTGWRWHELLVGGYVHNAGWLVTTDRTDRKNEVYRLYSVGWDGVELPEKKPTYADYKKQTSSND